jgi:predicted DNA-binding protein
MIWFGNLNRILPAEDPVSFGPLPERERMRRALEWVAERAPHLSGDSLLDALAASRWIDRSSAARLIPEFGDALRRLSFRGRIAAEEFRRGVGCIFTELVGDAAEAEVGPESAIRYRRGEHEGIVLAHPEVGMTVAGRTREAIEAAIEEMPDAVVIVARNFDRATADQLASLLSRTEVPGTIITLNLLLGLRAVAIRYQPATERVLNLLGVGRPVRSVDLALLGNR